MSAINAATTLLHDSSPRDLALLAMRDYLSYPGALLFCVFIRLLKKKILSAVICNGFLLWLDAVMQPLDFFSERTDAPFPACFGLIDQVGPNKPLSFGVSYVMDVKVATQHALLHPAVFRLVSTIFERPYEADPLLAVCFANGGIFLIFFIKLTQKLHVWAADGGTPATAGPAVDAAPAWARRTGACVCAPCVTQHRHVACHPFFRCGL